MDPFIPELSRRIDFSDKNLEIHNPFVLTPSLSQLILLHHLFLRLLVGLSFCLIMSEMTFVAM